MGSTLDLDGLQRQLWGFAGQRVITVAGRAGILDALADRPATPDAIAIELDLDPLATGKIVRALCAQGLVQADGDSYRLAAGLRPYFGADGAGFGPFLEHLHSMYERWGENLEPWLRGEGWSTAPRTPDETARFGAAMAAMGSQIARRVAVALDLTGVRTVLDVGGGWGQYSKAMCEIRPEIRATVLDVSQVAEAAPASILGTELEGRISWIGGNYLETDYGSGYDLVLMANILHQELPSEAATLVRRAAGALAPGGRAVVVDFAIDDAKQTHPFGTLFAINMRSFGDTYSEPEIRGWMEDAGLEDVTTTFIGPDRWIISGQKQ
ncbi:MAG: methyltransferase [Candidatus Sulfomarinibacteraceae bacterium]